MSNSPSPDPVEPQVSTNDPSASKIANRSDIASAAQSRPSGASARPHGMKPAAPVPTAQTSSGVGNGTGVDGDDVPPGGGSMVGSGLPVGTAPAVRILPSPPMA